MPVTLIREDTEIVVLTLDGMIGGDHVYDGQMTDHAMADGSTRADGRVLHPRTLSLAGVVGHLADVAAQQTGSARIEAVVSTLRALQVEATPISAQFPGRAPIASMGLERFSEGFDPTTDAPIVLDLKEQLTATSRRVALTALPGASAGPPRADVAPGLADVAERGTLPNTSISAGGVDQVRSALGR